MKKRRFIALAVVFSVLLVFAAGCGGGGSSGGGTSGGTSGGGSQQAELPKITLALSLQDPVTARMGVAMQAWADEVNELTNGGLTITLYGGGSLAGPMEVRDFVIDGTADIGWMFIMGWASLHPLSLVTTLPMNGPSHPAQAAEVLWDLYESTPEMRADIDPNFKILKMYGNPANFIATVDTPFRSIDDIQGMRIRAPGGAITEILRLWGASPESVPATETYDAMQRGNIAGTSWEWQGIDAFKIHELINYVTPDVHTYMGVFFLGMNWDSWNNLPQEYQDVLTATTQRAGSIRAGNDFYAANEAAKALAFESNPDLEIVQMAPEEVARLKVIADQFAAEWVEKNSVDGFDAQGYYERMQASLARHAR